MRVKVNNLIKKLKEGKSEYFDDFYTETKNGVFYIILGVIKDRALAEDIMQETYISFLNNIDNVDETKNWYSYLLTSAKNKAINEVKRNNRLVGIDFLENLEAPQVDNFNPLLDLAKQKLDPEEWKILKLTIIDGYRRVEVAKMFGKPVSTINWRYNKILSKVKKLYKEVYGEEF